MRISTEIEIPEALHDRAVTFIESNHGWDYDRAVAAALVLFLVDQDKKAKAKSC